MDTWVGSPNFDKGRGGKPISLIVVHHMAGTLAGTDRVFQDTTRRTSAHYGVGRGGEVHRYVLDGDTAFHAGNYDTNQRSIGIEHEDLGSDNYTDIEYQTSAQLIRGLCSRYGLPVNANTIRGHRAFVATACPGTLDISRLIELAQKGDAMSTVDINIARILAFNVGGRNGHEGRKNALAGETDADLIAGHVGRETNEDTLAWYVSTEAKNWRDKALPAVYAQAARVPELEKQVADLTKQLADAGTSPKAAALLKAVQEAVK